MVKEADTWKLGFYQVYMVSDYAALLHDTSIN